MKLSRNMKDSLLIFNGFHSWKEAVRCLNTHEQTSTHKKAVELLINIPETTRDIGEILSSSLAAKKTANLELLSQSNYKYDNGLNNLHFGCIGYIFLPTAL